MLELNRSNKQAYIHINIYNNKCTNRHSNSYNNICSLFILMIRLRKVAIYIFMYVSLITQKYILRIVIVIYLL